MPSAAKDDRLRVDAATPCEHCGLPVGNRPVGKGPYFCCSGCAAVYDALQSAGLSDTYYRLRELTPEAEGRPAEARVDDLRLSEFDTPSFLAAHTTSVDPGGDERCTELYLDGVHCAACVWLVERLPFVMDGVSEARLDLPRARLSLRWHADEVQLSEVARRLSAFGYTTHATRQAVQVERTASERRLLTKAGVCWALAGNVMLVAWALYSGMGLEGDADFRNAARWISLLLAIPSVLYGGSEFFKRAWASIGIAWRGRSLLRLHVDTPISLGILAGFSQSAWSTVTGSGEVWFDSITVLIAALLTARWIQVRSRRFAGDATERLLSLIPSMARRRMKEGGFETVPAEELRPGDVVEVPAGEVIPVDGSVLSGRSSLNNAVLTGESRPEPVEPGLAVQAGATNIASPLQVLVSAVGDETRVGKLLAWVRDSEHRRAPVMLLADRLSGYFVAVVLALAVLAAVIWLPRAGAAGIHHVVALLVITCPCALGMATPLAMAVASGRAARAGIYIKSDEATQMLTDIDTVVLDKTGTLTEGRMTVVEWTGDRDALGLAAALESASNHPIAAAITTAWAWEEPDAGPPESSALEGVIAEAGAGIQGKVQGHSVMVGKPAWLEAAGVAVNETAKETVDGFAASAHTPVAVAVDGQLKALLAVGDRVRKETAASLQALRKHGRMLYILSGDDERVVKAVAARVGIEPHRALGGVDPEGKRSFIETLKADGRRVAMVGDGVNDAAALQAADVGISVHGGSTAGMVAADVFMTRSGFAPLEALFAGSHHVMRVVKRNLLLSLLYNATGAVAALLGLVTPFVAAIAMPISSLVVVLSSVLQRSFPQPAARAEAAPPAFGGSIPLRKAEPAAAHETV